MPKRTLILMAIIKFPVRPPRHDNEININWYLSNNALIMLGPLPASFSIDASIVTSKRIV